MSLKKSENYEKVSNHCVGKRNGRATPWLLTFSGNLLTACEEFRFLKSEQLIVARFPKKSWAHNSAVFGEIFNSNR